MKPLEDGLERILERGELPESSSDLGKFLAAHPGAKQDVSGMLEISQLIRENFRVAEGAEDLAPAAGFYARVMARIEAEASQQSFWSFFIDPVFGGRLIAASLTLTILLLAANFLTVSPEMEPQLAQAEYSQSTDEAVLGAVLVSNGEGLPSSESSDVEADRGAALLQLTTYDQ